MDLVILAGGKGTRIKKQNPYLPKPMIKFGGISFLQLLINHYSKFDFEKIYILAGYKGSIIKKKFHNKMQNFTEIKCLIEDKPMDTAGSLNLIKNKIKKDFILINGDTFLDLKYSDIINLRSKKGFATIGLIKSNKKKIKFNNLELNKKNKVIKKEKSNLINAGIYYFKKKVFNFINNKPLSIENYLLPLLLTKKYLNGVKLNSFFLDIGTPQDLSRANNVIKKKFSKPSLFLDRDGVINYDPGYTHEYKKFKFRKNVIKFLKLASKLNLNIFIITNQAGIAKGFFKLSDFYKLHKKLKKFLISKEIYIDDVQFCPHHPLGNIKKYKKKCFCRKPGVKMIDNIKNKWFINSNTSLFIGDQKKDEITAKKSGFKFFYVEDDIFKQFKNLIR